MLNLPTTPDPQFTALIARDITTTQAAQRQGLLTDITRTHPTDRPDFVRALSIAFGGTLQEPSGGSWQPSGCTLSMAGITGMGDTLPEAITDWITATTRSLRGDIQ
jgi:hypothetical protein